MAPRTRSRTVTSTWRVLRSPAASAIGPCPGNDHRIVSTEREDPLLCVDHALDAATAVDVDERIGAVEEDVPRVHHVGALEVDHGVAVGVGRRNVENVGALSIEMKGDGVAEGDHRERGPGRCRDGAPPHLLELLHAQALAHIAVGDDHGPRLAEILVASRVVAVPVGVDHEADRFVADLADRRSSILGERRVLIVHQEDPVLAGGDGQVAPAPVSM